VLAAHSSRDTTATSPCNTDRAQSHVNHFVPALVQHAALVPRLMVKGHVLNYVWFMCKYAETKPWSGKSGPGDLAPRLASQ
jgi:hypothetical protein